MAPGCRRLEAFEPAQVQPALLLLVEKRIFEGKGFPGQLLVARAPTRAGQPGQGPTDSGYAVSKTAHAFRGLAISPVNLSIPVLSAFGQKVSEFGSEMDVLPVSAAAGQHQQWRDGPSRAH